LNQAVPNTTQDPLPGPEVQRPVFSLGLPNPERSALSMASLFSLASAYWQASRPRILAMLLLTMTATAVGAGSQPPAWPLLFHALVGSALVIIGAIALNQRLEYQSDARMPRTASRPLPSGRLSRRQMTVYGLVTTLLGLADLALLVNRTAVLLAATSWTIYVWIYTPSKRLAPWQTAIGAVAGAMPTLLGGAVAGAAFSPHALTLFGIVYFWQFPHAMAIAWLYREQFASAEVKLPTVLDPSGRSAGLLSLAGVIALFLVSLVPVITATAGWGYLTVIVLLAVGYLIPVIRFLVRPKATTARQLLGASFVYLPVAIATLLVVLSW